MAVYYIADVKSEDPTTFQEYVKLVGPIYERYGVKVLARGGATETIEGDWQPQRLVVLQFDDTEHFRRWYDSPEYSAAREIRWKAASTRAVLTQGV
jgi:uncharacterized protein (DUF1330 family)